jgi:hypothetical protein
MPMAIDYVIREVQRLREQHPDVANAVVREAARRSFDVISCGHAGILPWDITSTGLYKLEKTVWDSYLRNGK